MFTESLKARKSDLFTTLIRAATKTSGVVLDSPSHLKQFNQILLTILRVPNPQEIFSTLHFRVMPADVESGTILMTPSDMRALDVAPNDLVIALETRTGQWWTARAISENSYKEHTIGIPKKDSELFSLDNPMVDLLRYESEVIDIENAIFSFKSSHDSLDAETASFVYLHDNAIRNTLHQKILGKGTRLNFKEDGSTLTMTMVCSEPDLETGQVGRLGSSKIEFRPSQVFNEFNIILCISKGRNMNTEDIKLKTLYSLKQRLSSFPIDMKDLGSFLSKLDTTITRSEAALLLSLLVIHAISVNRTEGKLALVTGGESLRKFTIQRGKSVQSYAEYATDLQSEEVLISLIYTVLDSLQEDNGNGKSATIFRAIAEALEDLGLEQPTLVMLFTSNFIDDDEITPFIRAISRNERYHVDIFGLGTDFKTEMTGKLLEDLDTTIYPVTQLSAHFFDQYFLNAIDKLCSKS
jgi:hypothetical protein